MPASGAETDRACDLARLVERVAHLESVLARTDVGVYSVTADLQKVLYINPATEAIFGRPAGDFEQSPRLWLEAIDPRDLPFIGDPLADLRQEGTARHCYRIVRPDGTMLWVLDQSHRVDGEDARQTRFDCLFTDITHRMEVERRLRESEECFRQLAETAPVAIALASVTGKPIFSNEYSRRLHGQEAGQLSPQAWFEMIHPEDRAAMAAALTAGNAWEGDYRVLLPDGGVRWIVGSRVPLRDAGGTVYAYLGTGVDITERTRAEEALRESEAKLLALIESSEEPVFSVDDQFRLVMFNSAAARYVREVFGRELRAGMAVEDAFPAELAPSWRDMLAQAMRQGRLTVDLERRDGRYASITLNAITRAGRAIGVSVFNKDIEDRRRAEQALRALPNIVMRAHEEERRTIVHDLHDGVLQDLNALKLAVQSPKRAEAGVDNAFIAARIDDVIRAVRELSLRLRPSTLDDLGLLPTVRSLAQRTEAESGVQIFVSAEPVGERIDSEVETAGFRIVQEALGNACRHAQAKTVYVRIAREQETLAISIDDDGVGFDVELARQRAIRAGHFGISVMEERAAALQGTFSIRSMPGSGTKISVRIPLARPAEAPSAARR